MYLVHHGIKGQKWGVRRFQNEDRTWTAEGKIRYGNDNKPKEKIHLIKDTIKESKSLKSELRTYLGNKTGHYSRNEHNVDLPKNDADAKKKGWIKLTDEQSAMHQNSKEGGVNNTKWISQDGHREVVFTGKGKNQHITSDVRDEGTYNYANPIENPLGHTVYDVLPYIFLGNDANDPTTTAGRLYVSAANFLDKDVNFDPEKMSKGKKAVYDLIMVHADIYSEELYHHGIKGQKWGIRRFQNEDGTLTEEGKARYGSISKKYQKNYRQYRRYDKKYGPGRAFFKYDGKKFIEKDDLKDIADTIEKDNVSWDDSRKTIVAKANQIIEDKKPEWKKIGEKLYKVAPEDSGWYSLMEERIREDIVNDKDFKKMVNDNIDKQIASSKLIEKQVDEIGTALGKEIDPKHAENGKNYVLSSLTLRGLAPGLDIVAYGPIDEKKEKERYWGDVYEVLDLDTSYRDWIRSEEKRLSNPQTVSRISKDMFNIITGKTLSGTSSKDIKKEVSSNASTAKISKDDKNDYLGFMKDMLSSPKMVDDHELTELTVMEYLDNKYGQNNYDRSMFNKYIDIWEKS